MAIAVDLHAPTVKNDQRIWRMFPGKGYQFLRSFLEQQVGYLDFPGFALPRNFSEKPDLIPAIARTDDVRAAFFKHGPHFNPRSISLDVYAKARRTQHRSRLQQALFNLLLEAKEGDYVVLPEQVWQGKIHVGRISSNQITDGYYSYRYGKTAAPARAIVWSAEVAENSVSTALSNSLRHQHPFSLLEKSLYIEVLSLLHGSFVYGDYHAAMIFNTENDFLDADAALLGTISRLASAAAVAVDAGGADLGTADLLDLLLRTPSLEYTCSQSADIHSPGFNRYVSGKIVPLLIAALLAACIELGEKSSKDNLQGDVNSLVMMNSAPGADPQCTAKVSKASAMVFSALGTDRTWKLCEDAKAAAARAGLKSSATPKPLQSQPPKR